MPTATQDACDGQDTLLRPAPVACAGRAIGELAHERPFQVSMSEPTAVHALLAVQDTPPSASPPFGARRVFQRRPSHRYTCVPTAMQAAGYVHETAFRPFPPPLSLLLEQPRFGRCRSDQRPDLQNPNIGTK